MPLPDSRFPFRLLPRGVILLVSTAVALSLRADTIVLTSGVRYTDVKARPSGQSHVVSFRDGRVLRVPNRSIRSLRPGATTWTRPQVAVRKRADTGTAAAKTNPKREATQRRRATRLVRITRGDPRTIVPGRPWGPLVKSAILPGWGQYSLERRLVGTIFAGAAVSAFAEYWSVRTRHANAERRYNDPTVVGLVSAQTLTGTLSLGQAAMLNLGYLGAIERRVIALERRGNLVAALLGIVWGWNMLDIYYGGPPWERPWFGRSVDSRKRTWSLSLERDRVSLGIQLRW